MRHETIIQTKRTQTVRFVSIIDPKVDAATTKEEELATLPIVNGGREIAMAMQCVYNIAS